MLLLIETASKPLTSGLDKCRRFSFTPAVVRRNSRLSDNTRHRACECFCAIQQLILCRRLNTPSSMLQLPRWTQSSVKRQCAQAERGGVRYPFKGSSRKEQLNTTAFRIVAFGGPVNSTPNLCSSAPVPTSVRQQAGHSENNNETTIRTPSHVH